MVELKTRPAEPVADEWTVMTFHITRDDKPVVNLQPLDTLGHLILIREGAEEFIYAHSIEGEAGGIRAPLHTRATPEEVMPQDVHTTHGPDVTFHARFPAPGLYRAWADFAPGDDRIRPDYVIVVRERDRPALTTGTLR